jgi:aspartate aminotransferase
MLKFSSLCQNFSSQPMFEILSNVQALERSGARVLHFEIGEPDFPTPENITQAAIDALSEGHTKYAPSGGIFEFKEVIQRTTKSTRGFIPSKEQILVTPGANAIIFLALKCVLETGDEVIVPDPGFPTYYSAIKALGGIVRPLKLNPKKSFSFVKEDLEGLVNERTRAILLNSPSNPTGQVLPSDLITDVFSIATKHKLLLISDEIYSRIIFSSEGFNSPSKHDECKTNTLILNGFSKAFSMTGWRLGAAIGPESLIKYMENLTSTIVSCVPPFIQMAGIEAIEGDQQSILKMVEAYRRRAQLFTEGLNKIDGINCEMPKGSIYCFPHITGTGLTSEDFCKKLLETCKIAATPGTCFGENGEGFVRFSFVNSEKQIKEALVLMTKEFGLKANH